MNQNFELNGFAMLLKYIVLKLFVKTQCTRSHRREDLTECNSTQSSLQVDVLFHVNERDANERKSLTQVQLGTLPQKSAPFCHSAFLTLFTY